MRKDNRPKLMRKKTEEAQQIFFNGFEHYSNYICQKNNTALYSRKLMNQINSFLENIQKAEKLSEAAVSKWLSDTKKYAITISEIFPESTELMSEESMNSAFYEKFKAPKNLRFPLRNAVKEYTAKNITAEMEKAAEQAIKLIEQDKAEQAKEYLSEQLNKINDTVSFFNARQFLVFYEQKMKAEKSG